MKKNVLSLALLLTAMTAAAQDDDMFCYIYDDATQTATVTYYKTADGSAKGGTYTGDVVIPAKAPNGYAVTTIGEDAFRNSNTMTSLTIPATIDSIGSRPFENCDAKLKKITIEDSDKKLRCHIWEAYPLGIRPVFGTDVDVEEVYIGRTYSDYLERGWVEVAGQYTISVIYSNEYVKKVTLGNVYQEVPDGLCYGCESLQSISLPSKVKRVGKKAFSHCESLANISIPSAVESIGEEAFYRCNVLKDITLPSSLQFIGGSAFAKCTELGPVFTIPASVDSIGASILDECPQLKRINIPYSNNPLKYTCPSQFTNSLRAAAIDTLYMDRYIDGAFSDNRTIKTLYVGPNVTAIKNETFSSCYNMTEVYSLNPVPPTCEGASVFYSGTKSEGRLHVPTGSLGAYKAAFVWQDFFNIDEQDAAVMGIEVQKDGNSTVTASYTLGGQRTAGTQRGLLIQRMSDGSVRKVITNK